MSLVAYDNSDDSGDESDKNEDVSEGKTFTNDVPFTHDKIQDSSESKGIITESDNHHSLGEALPRPKQSNVTLSAEELTKRLLFSSVMLPKNKSTSSESLRRAESRRDVPMASEIVRSHNLSSGKKTFNEDEESKPKKLKPSTKGSGLFSLLPAPKNLVVKETNRKLIPRVVSKDTNVKKSVVPVVKKAVNKSSSLINYPDSGEESGGEDGSTGDFFSLTSKETEISASVEENLIPDLPDEKLFAHGRTGSLSVAELLTAKEEETPSCSSHSSADQNEVFGPQPADSNNAEMEDNELLQLDEEAITRLCGRRGRQEISESQIIDVCGESHLPDPKEWLTKQLTEEQETRSHRRRDGGPTTQQRRKHQITYLAFQAKERELELKNQWAQNRMSRRQTQAKYGF
ncbi:hypothetical protein J437_LFUL012907 [Ladona fulva]|uniref:Proline-rich protein PRCC n=1 Tax=Ladona fulva TaxID=123851 RepID=A0A8K0KEK0_LADFU|nr:hypothetical protein J437_LFUL012907 [Ladona fulva]